MRTLKNFILLSTMALSLFLGQGIISTESSSRIYAEEVTAGAAVETTSEYVTEETSNELSTEFTTEDMTVANPTSSTEEESTTSEEETTTSEEETTTSEEETTIPSSEPPTKILFIGNSSTYYNNMPQMVKGLANAAGRNAEIQAITASNYKLYQFATEGSVYYNQIMNTLKSSRWDYVVIQDHREVIIQTPVKTEEALAKLYPAITASGAQLVLYETQADFMGRNFTINNTSLFLGHTEIQYYMTKNYFSVGNKINAIVAPVGVNYTRCINMYPDINLYNKDLHHPSVEGSYLAACTLYGILFDSSAYQSDFLPNSSADTAKLLSKMDVEDAKKLQALADATLMLDKKQIELQKGKTASLIGTFTISPGNTLLSPFLNRVEYFSLNDSSVTVNRYTGAITALGVGNTMIMATTDSGLMAMCSVSVKQPATSITIAEPSITKVHRKDTITYTPTLLPDDTTDGITWTSSDTSVATVDANGVVTAKKVGTAKITARADSGVKVSRTVRVKLATPTKVKVKKLKTKAKSKKYANLRITWKKNKNAVKYYVYRSTKKNSGYKKVATVKKAKYTDKNKLKGKTYYYKIVSVYSNTKCNSDKSTATKYKLAK